MVAMARGLLLCWVLAACVFHAPRAEPPRIVSMDPPDGTQSMPSSRFNIMLSFQEAVQAGPGSIRVGLSSGAGMPLLVACSGGLLISGLHAVVPVNADLEAGLYEMRIPADCFLSQDGELMESVSTTEFTAVADALRAPRLRQEVIIPPSGSYVPPSQKFTFVFSEAVQGGDASVSIMQLTPFRSNTFMSLKMDEPTALVEFDQTIPGKITFLPVRLPENAAYSFQSEAGALRGLSGLSVGGSGFLGSGNYGVKVSAGLISQQPRQGQISDVSKRTSIVLEFDEPVVAGDLSSEVKLCTAWRKSDPCSTAVSVPAQGIYFLGRVLILRPAVDLQPGVHNVSIPSELARYFQGFVPDSRGAWPYSFSVDPEGALDSAAPELVSGLVNCSTDSGDSPDYCAAQGLPAGSMSLPGSEGHSVAVPGSSTFKLYFSEQVEVASGRTAELQDPDSSSAPTPVDVSVGSGSGDCVATLSLSLQTATRYTLTLGNGVLTDSSTDKNPYAGSTFSFFVPLSLISSTLAEDVMVPVTSTISLTFDGVPRPGTQAYFTILSDTTSKGKPVDSDSRTVDLSDVDQVLIQEHSIFLTPMPALLPDRTYSVSMSQQALLFLREDLMITFSTRADDFRKPVPIYAKPQGTLSKFNLDKIAPSVRFSERLTPVAGRHIFFSTPKGVQYSLDAADDDCGLGGTEEDACVVADGLGSEVSFYPLGKLAAGSTAPAPWATKGTTYHVTVEAGAFSDAVQPLASSNAVDEMQFTFLVTGDNSGPAVVSAVPPGSDGSMSGEESYVFLTFNEIVEAGDNDVSIRVWDHVGLRSPTLVATGPEKLRQQPGAGWRQTLVLSFDSAIQAASSGDHELQLYDLDTQRLRLSVPVLDAAIHSNLLLFNISSAASDTLDASQEQFFVRSSSAGAVVSVAGVAMEQPIDTRGTVLFQASTGSPAGTSPAMLWSSAEEFVCFSATGLLPDIQVYMSQEISSVDTAKKLILYDCGKEDACTSATSPSWSLRAFSNMVSVDAAKPFRISLHTSRLAAGLAGAQGSPLQEFHNYRLVLESGALKGFGGTPPLSLAVSISFSVCEVKYSKPASTLMRVYSARAFMTSEKLGARSFEVKISQSAITDQWGNPPASMLQYYFEHEADLPVLEPDASNPPNGGTASPKENIILAFNEVVQCGTGSLQLLDVETSTVRFEIDIARIAELSVNGNNLISGRYLIITPKTLCTGSPACTDLGPGQTYFLKTSAPGVLKDRIGNKMASLDTSDTWTFSVSTQDLHAPSIKFVAGNTLLPPEGIFPDQFVGYVYFTEQVVQAPGAMVTLQDCGDDLDCSTESDNSVSYLPAELSFGDGTGTSGYGMMRYSRYLTKVDRRYKVRIMPDLVNEVVLSGAAKSGPQQMYSFEVAVGQVPKTYLDVTGPKMGRKQPGNTRIAWPENGGMRLHFNEDVARGTGVVKYCLNSDARIDGRPACEPALFADGSPAVLDVADAIVDRRKVTFNWPKDLAYNQIIYVLMNEGLFKDVPAGNPSSLVEQTMYRFSIRPGDSTPPQLDYYTLPTTLAGSVELYFSEAVQLATGAQNIKVTIAGSTVSVTNLVTSVSGNTVNVQASWASGGSYQFDVPDFAVKDLAGNPMTASQVSPAFSTPAASTAPFALQLPAGQGSLALTEAISVPINGSTDVVPSATFKFTFAQTVQAGSGSISIGTLSLPVQECVFVGPQVVCDPPGYLARNEPYLVTIPVESVEDSVGASFLDDPLVFSFRTTDLDLVPPVLESATDGALEHINPSSLLTLHFNEVVQAGTGSIFVEDSGGTLAATINIQGMMPGTQVFFAGPVVHLAKRELEYGKTYTLYTSVQGVIEDRAGQPLGTISKTIRIVPEDETPPTVLAYIPRNESVGEAAPDADIRIYFSEAVQAVGGPNMAIEVSDGVITEMVRLIADRTNSGSVTILGSVVTVVPYQSMGYGREVRVSIPSDCFADLAGNLFAGTLEQEPYWQSASPVFEAVATSTAPPGRAGAVLQALLGGTLLLHGGRGDDGVCHSSTYISAGGSAWQNQNSVSSDAGVTLPAVAGAASTTDASGCVWMLGGQCSGSGTNTLWKTCTLGATWDPLPAPTTLEKGVAWPQTFSGQAIAVLGGWQLVVVDLGRGDCWLFQDKGATLVVRSAESLEFAPRRGSKLLVSSSNDLYLVGGHRCNNDACTDAQAFLDVWRSPDSFFVGRHWERLTSNYAAGLSTSQGAEIGRQGTAAVMTFDDTIYLLGGQKLDATANVASAFSSLPAKRDLSFESAPRLTVPMSSAVVHSLDVVTLYFGELIVLQNAESVKLLDLGLDKSLGGTGDGTGTIMPFAVSAKGQVLQLQRDGAPKLTAGHMYRVEIADGALTDAVGNKIAGFDSYHFSVSSDRTGPVVSVLAPTGTSVPPWTTLVLEADETLLAGSGSLELSCDAGASYRLPVSTAHVVDKRAFFELPGGARLTAGQQYTMTVPEGLFVDPAGNLASAAAFTFTVLSGVVTSSADGYAATNVVPPASTSVVFGTSDKTPPRVTQISPPSGATDVPRQGVAILVRYSEPVRFGSAGEILVTDVQSGNVVDGANVSDVGLGKLILVSGGVKLKLDPLQAGTSYRFSISEGAVKDLAGNPAPAVSGTFTCLSGNLDMQPPILVLTEPAAGAVDVPSSLPHITMWFSEKVEAGNGSITIARDGVSGQHVTVNINNVTITGTRLQLTLPKGALDTAGAYNVQLPAGLLLDRRRSAPDEGGGVALEEVSFSFTAKPADIVLPSLVATTPANENSPSFQLPESATLLLTFSETVQAGTGAATLVPQMGSRSLSFDVAGPEVVFEGERMLIVPAAELSPGEVYSLTMDDDAVVDSVGNSFAGLGAGDYVLSIAPRILFQRAGQFNLARYSVGATVDSSSNIYVVGGADGSKSNSTRRDVWRLRTHRPSHCSSYFKTTRTCPRSSCLGTPPTMGVWEADRVVWRPPSVDGQRCVDNKGLPQSQVGDLIQRETAACPCPECPELPPPLPANMVNETYLDAYALELAVGRPLALLCKRGYAATGNFSCNADTVFAAQWSTPYPSCEPKPCITPPPKVEFQDDSTAGSRSPCAGVSPQNPLAHGSTCPILCMPGYQPQGTSKGDGLVTCELGVYQLPVCEPQQCPNRYTITNGTLSCPASEVYLGEACVVLCDAGFELVGEKRANCTTKSTFPEATPQLTEPGFCQARSCGDLQLQDPRGVVLGYANGKKTTGSEASVGCETGYMRSETSFDTFQCISNSEVPEDDSGWVGSLKCVRKPCNNFPDVGKGYFACGQPFFGDECRLECELGYVMIGGTGIYTCQAEGRMTGVGRCREVNCPPAPMGRVPHAIKNDCPSVMDPGVECEVTSCRDGYEPRGSFMCKYGGFNKMPACIKQGKKADISWYYLSALTIFCNMRNTEIISDETFFWSEAAEAVADGLNAVELTDVPIIDNVVLLNDLSEQSFPASQGQWRIWMTFRVRAENVSEINYWLGQKQALVKARFTSSFEYRMEAENLDIKSMLLAPAEVAIAYEQQVEPKTITEEEGFFDRVTDLENSDTAEVALGAMVGIVLGLMVSLWCACVYRHWGQIGAMLMSRGRRKKQEERQPEYEQDFQPEYDPDDDLVDRVDSFDDR